MAAFDDDIRNMYDVSLKPRLLLSLIKEQIPDDKHPFRTPSDLSHVVYVVRTHRLLSEHTEQKHLESWNSAVDAWVNRLLMLTSSSSPDKCWAGICLLGLTCQECSSERFLASYAVWLQKLQLHIQLPPADSHFVKVAACASISDLFVRLGGFANAKKDGTSHAAKLIQPALKLLKVTSSDALWEGAVHLLCTIITYFPFSIRQHYDSVEATIVSKIMSGKCCGDILKKLGHCLALLPKSKGDEDSWSLMMRKVLLSINVHLSDAFQGLEDESKHREIMKILVPPGKDPPPPLGGQTALGENSLQAVQRPERLLISSVSTLMLCCCEMLTGHYPVQVTIPVRPLLLLAERVLMVDGSLSKALFPFMTAVQQESICPELPVLHLCSLELLGAVTKAVRSQLLPYAADIVRLLTDYFKRCALPELRVKVYSVIRILLMSMGVGVALFLAQDLINNAFVDLNSICDESGDASSTIRSKVSNEVPMQPTHKRRKHKTISSVEGQPERANADVDFSKIQTPRSLKIAALDAIEALLTVGGALRSESWRTKVDHLLIDVASDACKVAWALEDINVIPSNECTPTWEHFQLAALRALLASLVSPARVRPPYLAHGLELFHRGMLQETGTKVAEFCRHALLALEVLIHPRALPLIDFDSDHMNIFDKFNTRFPEVAYSGSQKQNNPFSSGPLGKRPYEADSDDELYESWLKTGKEVEAPEVEPGKDIYRTEEPASDERPSANAAVDGSGGNGDVIMVDSLKSQEPFKQSQERISQDGTTGGTTVLDVGATEARVSENAPRKDVSSVDKGNELDEAGERAYPAMANSERGKGFLLDSDNDSSADSIPDIVDEDTDSGSD